MFRPTREAPLLTEAGVLGLCPSLNSPVLNIEQLPVGPARSAILLFAGEYGGVGICVGLRSVDSGSVAYFAYAGAADDFATPDRAMDAALNFAEAMGFLFDDDVVAASGRSEALRMWRDLTGEPADSPDETGHDDLEDDFELDLEAGDGAGADGELGGELLLDDLAAGALPLDDGAALVELEVLPSRPARSREAPTGPPAAASGKADRRPVESPPGAGPSATLTKFRPPATAADKAAETTGGSHLGRIPLVRRRVASEDNRAERPGFLMRILSAF